MRDSKVSRYAGLSLPGLLLPLLLLSLTVPSFGQSQPTIVSNTIVPHLVKFSGTALDAQGNPHSGVVGITFALYKEEQGGPSLWLETQNVQADAYGQYAAYLGATKSDGVPPELFISGEAHWLGVQIDGQAEQPRVLLLSVPYALKAADAETVGGLPPSAFVLATPSSSPSSSNVAAATGASRAGAMSSAAPATVGGSGTANFIPLWTDSADLGNSILFQSGTGATARIGVNVTTPASTLDVKGGGTIRGTLNLPAQGTANATKGFNSQPLALAGSAFNSSAAKAANQTFAWETQPVGNNTSAASGALNLLFASGTSPLANTGLSIGSNGTITFAAGQTFPGTGSGTIAGVSAGTGLTGGGTTGNVTLNLDTTKIPQLNVANTFVGNQTVTGNVSATGVITGSSFQIGSNLFGYGSFASSNAFLGFGGSTIATGTSNTATGALALEQDTTGSQNTAIGASALLSNTAGSSNTAIGNAALTLNSTGVDNTASGFAALQANTTGSYNTASGLDSLFKNTTGFFNTAVGYLSGPDSAHPNLNNATAIGAMAEVTASNSLVLGSISGVNGAGSSTNVGIGTTAPAFTLDVHGTGNFTGPITFAAGQTFPGAGTITGITPGTALTGGGSSGSVTLNVDTTKVLTGITAGTGLTGGGTGGVPTLNVDTTQIPLLAAANTFTGNQTVNGNLSATGLLTGSAYNIGSDLFAFGSSANRSAFLGFAGSGATSFSDTAVGWRALYSDTGAYNTAIGAQALYSNTTGYQNAAMGVQALNANTTGYSNTASGASALFSNTGGYNNTASGEGALFYNTTGNFNTASGIIALASNTTGNYNTASGAQALNANTSGLDNTATGSAALVLNSTGSYNTASGYESLWSNTTGFNNTASGGNALFYNTTGSNNTALGFGSGPDSLHANLTNSTAIGANAGVTTSNSLVLGSINGVNGATADTFVGIGTTAPAAKLDVHGNANFTGPITFAAGQTFPGAGTITGVNPGTALTGGGSSGSVTLSVDTTKVVTGITAGTDLTGGGTGGVQTLNLDTTKVPQLNTANTFTGNQTVSGNLTATGVVTGSSYQLGSSLFAIGDATRRNAYLGFAGNSLVDLVSVDNTAVGWQALLVNNGAYNTAIGSSALHNNIANSNTAVGQNALYSDYNGGANTAIGASALMSSTGSYNTADGYAALYNNTLGNNNTAFGNQSLYQNSAGTYNTAIGDQALSLSNTTGSYNTALGASAGPGPASTNLTNSTAVGAFAEVTASNALVLGSINGVNGASASTNVGIGTTAPIVQLQVQGNDSTGTGVQSLTNNTSTAGNSFAVVATTSSAGVTNEMVADGLGTGPLATPSGYFGTFTNHPIGFITGNVERMVINASGLVGIGVAVPTHIFQVGQGKGSAFADGWLTYSSRRWKTNIQTLPNALARVEQLRGVSYDLKGSGKHEIGVIAEEVGQVVPEVVSFEANGKDAQGVDYSRLTALLIEAVKQQQQQIRRQQEEIVRLSGKVSTLEAGLRNTKSPAKPALTKVRPVAQVRSAAIRQ